MSLKENFKLSFKKYPKDLFLLPGILFFSALMQVFNRPIGTIYHLHIPLDDKIPFIKELIFVYQSWMPLLLIMGIVFYATQSRRHYLRYVFAGSLAALGADLVFPFFQTYVPRADLSLLGTDIASQIIKSTYMVDNPYCGFPSIHVSLCTVLIYFLLKANLKTYTKIILISYTALIAASTLLVKQHVFWDMPGGIVMGTIGILISKPIVNKYLQRFQ